MYASRKTIKRKVYPLPLVRSAIREGRKKIPALQGVLDYWGRFAYLGGVSLDYPYLGLDAEWADLMHKSMTDQIIKCAMPLLYQARIDYPDAKEWRQQIAWLLSFVSHIIADVTIHPVVNIRVGKYEINKDNHRRCEMYQDVLIYKEITGLDLHVSDNMKNEIRSCGTAIDLNDDVEELWKTCLQGAFHPRQLQDDQIDKWHAFFIKLVDLARSVMLFVKNNPAEATLFDDQELVRRATAFDPNLLESYKGYVIRGTVDGVIFVCTGDGGRGLLEDAECSDKVDKLLWSDYNAPCQFTLKPETACP